MSIINKVGGSLFLPTVLFITSVNNVFSRNSTEFNYQADILLVFIACFCAFFLCTFLLFYISSKWVAARFLGVVSISLGINIFLWNAFHLLFQGKLIDAGLITTLECIVFILTTVVLGRVEFTRINYAAFIGSAVLIGFGVYVAGINLVESRVSAGTGHDDETATQSRKLFTGNVYHLVFDQYQSEWWPIVRQAVTPIDIPLTYYNEFHTNDPYTQSSMASLISGRVYREGEDPNDIWNQMYGMKESLFSRLSKAGVFVHRYPHYQHHCLGSTTRCTPTIKLEGLASKLPKFVDMWFWQLLPSSIRLRFEKDAGQDWVPGVSLSETLTELGILKESKPEMNQKPALVQFQKMLGDEDLRPSSGQYIYAHFLLPHTPWNLDSECQIYTKEPNQRGTVLCVNVLISRFLNKLASLDHLENSLVIIHSDHGLYYYAERLNKILGYKKHEITESDKAMYDERPPWGKPTSSWTSNMIKTRAAALALVKWPKQKESAESGLDFQTINIAPTILEYFGVNHTDIEASSIQNLEKHQVQEPHNFYIPNTWKMTGVNSVSHYKRTNGEWNFVSEIWKKSK